MREQREESEFLRRVRPDETVSCDQGFAQKSTRRTHLLEAFDFLNTDVEKADRRPIQAKQDPGHGAAHNGEIDEMFGIGPD